MRLRDSCRSCLLSRLRGVTGKTPYLLASLAAFSAIVGHIFPVWLRFRGGKGVATGLGSWIGLAPRGVLVMVIVFVIMVALFRYISLGSITAAAIFPPRRACCTTITKRRGTRLHGRVFPADHHEASSATSGG